ARLRNGSYGPRSVAAFTPSLGAGNPVEYTGAVTAMKEDCPMNRLGIALVCLATVTLPSWAQITLSGSWEMSLALLPSTALEKAVLTLSMGFSGWTVSSVSTFNNSGFAHQEFQLKGTFGFFSVSGAMAFNPTNSSTVTVQFPPGCTPQTASFTLNPPEYSWAWIKPEFSFAGVTFSAMVEHWLYPYIPPYAPEATLNCNPNITGEICWPCCESTSYMRYTLMAAVPPISFTGRFEDCCTGIVFKDFSIKLTNVSLCCGVAYNAELYFTKAGFQYVKFTGLNLLGICCGFSLDISATFTAGGKEVTVTPKWQGLGDVCVQVFGDVLMNGYTFSGLAIYGYRIKCTLGDCNFIEFLTVVDLSNIDEVERIVGDIFTGDEYELIRFGLCGQGCCGGKYHVRVDVYFAQSGSLFDISRALVRTEIPLLANLVFTGSFGLPALGAPTLSVGMIFKF
ncbi:MAG: hypothetical protein N2320_04130, partial [Candidatus Bipolaricaulota bacterium]|nr:hypothetical protein [Candidatus Bipolaricaulota bacterium]